MTAFRLGLTGSIGMGNTTTARIFADLGVPVWDADAVVHQLYVPGGAAVAPLAALCPAAQQGGAISRPALKDWMARDPDALTAIESVVHPLVAADRALFLTRDDGEILLLDIPLLFEKGLQADLDATLLVTAPHDVQRARVLARPGMTEAALAAILARQMPDAEKRALATHIVETLSLASVQAYVRALIAHIRQGRPHA